MQSILEHLSGGMQGFMPHGMCYLWRPGILSLHVTSDALITASYFSIPFTLAYFIRKRRDFQFDWMIGCFAIFIIACGTTHLMEIVTVWQPVYWLSGFAKAVTAAASVPTAVLLVKLMPRALVWPSPDTLKKANDELQNANARLLAEIAERERAQQEAQRVNRELQQQNAELRRLHEMSTRLAHAHELPKLLEEILDSTIDLHEADFGDVQLVDEATGTLRLVSQRGFSADYARTFNNVSPVGGTSCARAWQTHRRSIIENVATDDEFAPHRALAAREGFVAVQSTPIMVGDDKVKGMFSTYFKKPRHLTDTELQISDLYMRLATELLQRSQDEAALLEARDAADKANKSKSRFLATASHDLRQPLQTLSLLNGSLRRLVANPDVATLVNEQELAIGAMSRLLNAILDISKLESGSIVLAIKDFDLAAVLEELRVEFAGLAKKKNLELEVSRESALVRSDPTLLGQILRNLTANALRYTASGVIRVSLAREGRTIRIDVQDSGIGIANDHLKHIFDEFYQVGVASNSVREGYGLGLNIVQRTARLLRHPLTVRSELGRGSIFSIEVPIGTSSGGEWRISGATVPAVRAREPHILVVDDNPSVLKATQTLLAVEGYRVSAANTLDEAVAVAASQPDLNLLLTDFHLENGVVGTEVIAAVRKATGARLHAVVISGDTSTVLKDAVRDDRVRLISKPINADELLALLASMLES